MKYLKFPLLFLLVLIIPTSVFAVSYSTENDVDFDIFSDNFNRANNTNIGNGWIESDNGTLGYEAEIINDSISMKDIDIPQIPCILTPMNITNQTGIVHILYTYHFAPLGQLVDNDFIIYARLGEDLQCGSGQGRVIQFGHGDDFKFPQDEGIGEQNFGYVMGSKNPIGNVNGTIDVHIAVDLDNKLVDIEISGPGLIYGNGTAYDIDYSNFGDKINSMTFFLNKVASYMPPVIIDNFQVYRSETHACGIEISELDYGHVKPGESSEQILMINATGDYGSTIQYQIGHWLDIDSNFIINGINTKYSLEEDVPFTRKTSVKVDKDFEILDIVPKDGTILSYWETNVTVEDETFKGNVYQKMTYIPLCD